MPTDPTCCDRAYHCPTSGEAECAEHGGFDVCCDAPHLHIAASTDPLVSDLVGWLRGGGDSPAPDDVARMAAKFARLSAVLAAAREVAAVVRADPREMYGLGAVASDLADALAAADGGR